MQPMRQPSEGAAVRHTTHVPFHGASMSVPLHPSQMLVVHMYQPQTHQTLVWLLRTPHTPARLLGGGLVGPLLFVAGWCWQLLLLTPG